MMRLSQRPSRHELKGASDPLRALPVPLALRLAALGGEREGVAEVALSPRPQADLDALAALGLIEPMEGMGGDVWEVCLTARGRWAIPSSRARCALPRSPVSVLGPGLA